MILGRVGHRRVDTGVPRASEVPVHTLFDGSKGPRCSGGVLQAGLRGLIERRINSGILMSVALSFRASIVILVLRKKVGDTASRKRNEFASSKGAK